MAAYQFLLKSIEGRAHGDGPNRDLVSRTCSACHDLAMAVAARRTREGWNATIDEMVTYGMNVTPDERRLMLDYLTTYLPPR